MFPLLLFFMRARSTMGFIHYTKIGQLSLSKPLEYVLLVNARSLTSSI
jgi:hypothetical protein